MNRPQLDERHRRILRFVVESHVSSAEPVGSQFVRAAYHLSISPATIRSAMQHLEESGYLGHPHTSAGRVPTEEGYRFYVDELMPMEALPAATRRAVARSLKPHQGEVFPPEVPRVLARASRLLSVVAVRTDPVRRVDRMDLVALEDQVLVLAIRESDGRSRTTSWRPQGRVDAAVRERSVARIRASLPLGGSAAMRCLGAQARLDAGDPAALLAAEVLERGADLLEAGDEPAVRIEGAEHIAAQPEFQSADRLRPLVSLLADRAPIAKALDAVASPGCARVSIGSENGSGPMRAWSIVGIAVTIGGTRGTVGVVGPVRMPYQRLVALVNYVGETLSEAG